MPAQYLKGEQAQEFSKLTARISGSFRKKQNLLSEALGRNSDFIGGSDRQTCAMVPRTDRSHVQRWTEKKIMYYVIGTQAVFNLMLLQIS